MCHKRQLIFELIDTQWDVNVIGCGLDRLNWNELIDTQWDVNYENLDNMNKAVEELIDTQWDVNNYSQPN